MIAVRYEVVAEELRDRKIEGYNSLVNQGEWRCFGSDSYI